jgi:hypothetical protein
MAATYPPVEKWVIAEGIFRRTLEVVGPIGQSGREAGAFWLGTREATAHVYSVVLPHGVEVEERRRRWAVSHEVFGAITRWAKPRDLCLLAVAHSHVRGVPPILSWTDRNLGVRVPGMLAAVIDKGGDEADHLKWGWYVFENADYRALAQDEICERIIIDQKGEFEAWSADASGVRSLRT